MQANRSFLWRINQALRSPGAPRSYVTVHPECQAADASPGGSPPRHQPAMLPRCGIIGTVSTVVAFLCLVLAAVFVQIGDPRTLVGPVKYTVAAYSGSAGGAPSLHRPWNARSFRRGHRMEVVDTVPIHGSNLVHIRNVCVQGGENGLILPHMRAYDALGMLDRYRPGSHMPAAFREMTSDDVRVIFGKGGGDELTAAAIQMHGPAFFINCWNRAPLETNPSHWLMKVNKMYEIAEVVHSYEGGASPLPAFEHLAFHQCPSYNMTIKSGAWSWGDIIMEAASSRWTDAGLWNGSDAINVIELNMGDRNWTCFDDLYFETSYNTWYPAPRYQQSWIQTLQQMAASSTSSSTRAALPARDDTSTLLGVRCRTGALRIHLFQRSTGSTLRSFSNLDQVRALLQNFTSMPIPIVTVNDSTSLASQADAFREFDVLVTPHGSQISNIIFSDPNTTAIVEVLPVVRDIAFYVNAMDAHFASYIVSTGHTPAPMPERSDPVCDQGKKHMDEHCSYEKKSGLWKCPDEWKSKLTTCDTLVDLSILKQHLKKAVSDLCQRQE